MTTPQRPGADDERLARVAELRAWHEGGRLSPARIVRPGSDIGLLLELLKERDAEIARLRAPAGGDLVERVKSLFWRTRGMGSVEAINELATFATAVQHEAVEAAAAFHAAQPGNPAMRAKEADAIRALAEER